MEEVPKPHGFHESIKEILLEEETSAKTREILLSCRRGDV
jgi:hypothetical protein